jgi:formylglycine-generating enzyme required for sulfatase activity
MRCQSQLAASLLTATMFVAQTAAADDQPDSTDALDPVPASVEITEAAGPTTSDTVTALPARTTPDDSFVAIPANPAFSFKSPLATDGAGPVALPAYAIARDLVTNADYYLFVKATGHAAPPGWTADGEVPVGLGTHPVVQVGRADAEAYAAWETSLSPGWTVRLPVEAELENAARGVDDTLYPWGSSPDVTYDAEDGAIDTPLDFAGVVAADYLRMYGDAETAMSLGATSGGGVEQLDLGQLLSVSIDGAVAGWSLDGGASGFVRTDLYARTLAVLGYTTAVGSFAASPSGLDDMAGNVWEWTESARVVPTGKTMAVEAAVRGGSWSSDLASCTTTYRGEGRDPAGSFGDVGFRLVASAVSAPST